MIKNDTLHELVFMGGPPGSGKSSIAQEFTALDNSAQQISAGDVMRDIRSGALPSRYSPSVQEAIKHKALVAPEVYSGIMLERIKSAKDGVTLSLIDGFPHSKADWDLFDDQIQETRIRTIGFVALEATLEVCVTRMEERGVRNGEELRIEPNEEAKEFYIRRWHEYVEKRVQLIEIFQASGVPIALIDANEDKSAALSQLQATVQGLRGC